jgi:hypothetical protein
MVRKCKTPGCKHDSGTRMYCSTCRTRKYKQTHLLKYLYQTWKDNARRRGKEHIVTYDEFVEFCKDTKYDQLRGIGRFSLQIDRIRDWEGYHKDNIRAITLIENVMKENGVDFDLDPEFQMEKEPCPF